MTTRTPPALHDMGAMLREMDEHTSIFVLVQGPVNGAPHWAYAEIQPSRYPAFLEAQDGPYQLADFARRILAHGPGTEPPPGEIERIKAANPEINFTLEQELKALLDAAKQNTTAQVHVTSATRHDPHPPLAMSA